uniref:Ig-like domain-containing protein n=1 Tax=Periophthalmus magnuspinnatus TaxID=409849 RepID=A0A3B4BLI4_9GOBI
MTICLALILTGNMMSLRALSRSCVVIPCTYENPEDLLLTRGIWAKRSGGVVYHNGPSQIVDHFRGRTQIVGDLNRGDCSLEIDDIKPFDNGPFCFMAEKESIKYRFNNSSSPEIPVMTKTLPEAAAGSVMTVSCSVTHTCPTHAPKFVWSVATLTNEVTHTALKPGIWEITSNISFIVPNEDGKLSVTCTAVFWRNKQESNTAHFISMNVMMPVFPVLLCSLPLPCLSVWSRAEFLTPPARTWSASAQSPSPAAEYMRARQTTLGARPSACKRECSSLVWYLVARLHVLIWIFATFQTPALARACSCLRSSSGTVSPMSCHLSCLGLRRAACFLLWVPLSGLRWPCLSWSHPRSCLRSGPGFPVPVLHFARPACLPLPGSSCVFA